MIYQSDVDDMLMNVKCGLLVIVGNDNYYFENDEYKTKRELRGTYSTLLQQLWYYFLNNNSKKFVMQYPHMRSMIPKIITTFQCVKSEIYDIFMKRIRLKENIEFPNMYKTVLYKLNEMRKTQGKIDYMDIDNLVRSKISIRDYCDKFSNNVNGV